MPPPYRRSLGATLAVSLALTIAFLFLPLAGTDLSAQVARGHFVKAYGLLPVDFRWYGGIFPLGYSFLTGPLNALLGARGVGAIGSVLGALALAFVFVRTRVARPVIAGLFTGLAGAALLLAGRRRDGLTLGLGAAVPLAVTWLLFRDGGVQPFDG